MKRVLRISLLAILGLFLFKPVSAQIAVGISVGFGPPALPVYEMPPCPQDGWIWTPGYWAWDADDSDYYWVPGTWVAAPEPGYLWTPAWWGWEGGFYRFHEGYWGLHVGFYGGINYGFGYFGHGFYGGRWDGGHFMYNTAVVRVNETVIRNVYVDKTVIVNDGGHVSYNGGEGGVVARPTEEEQRAEGERHIQPVAEQTRHAQEARGNPQMRASANQGRPPVAATARPGEFSGHDAVQAKSAGAPYHPPANRGQNGHAGNENQRPGNENARPGNENGQPAENNSAPAHARDLQPHQAPAPEGNSSADKKFQRQQEQLAQKQNQEHQKLAQQQQKEDQQAQQKKYTQPKQQQMEQKHQQQTQQMEQRHQQQQQQMQQRQPQPKPKHPSN